MTVTDQGLEQPGAAAATRPSVAVKNCSCRADQSDGTVDHHGPAPCPPLCLAVTMESMKRCGELITARRISTPGGREGSRVRSHSEEKQNERRRENILVIPSSAPLPRWEARPRAASPPRCSGSAGLQSSFLSKLPALLHRRRPAG